MIVRVSPDFIHGVLNSRFFTDIPLMQKTQKIAVRDFIEAVREDRLLVGKNKTSWQDNQGREIPHSELYKQGNCWHYHSGPYASDVPNCYTYQLEWNVHGLTSSAVIHYQKISADEIFLLAYSPNHIPFPKAFPSNPLFARYVWQNSSPNEPLALQEPVKEYL